MGKLVTGEGFAHEAYVQVGGDKQGTSAQIVFLSLNKQAQAEDKGLAHRKCIFDHLLLVAGGALLLLMSNEAFARTS
eukprot:CAMPEP_0173461730 /NCGR_PEP_ID=MMETSP1357-20121228/65440_1 /TAXON_ID=77926 /ORGANISM="Hemiselmis rufescens, Strain PCC563" /LENGTH=76 /DNA_ID=CAMNT_0014429407 /DNA_START=66 /DNA_END=292 /DNA_ORIENTATION=-